jgi:DNA-binding CsgD family transcriptional regulator
MAGLKTKDLRAIVDFVGDAATIEEPAPFTRELLERMTAMLGCDFATYNEFDFARRAVLSWVTFPPEEADDLTMTVADWDDLTAELDHDRGVERDGIVTASDHYSRAQRACFESGFADLAEFEILDRMCVRIGPPGARFVLDRRDRDFEGRDRLLLHHLQPHLMNLWRRGWIRRRLHAALDALDDDSVDGIMFVDDRGGVEFASASARRLLETHLGSAIPLPTEVRAWRDNGRDSPLVVSRNGSRLVVRSVDRGATLLVREEAAELRLLTRRQLEVMRCVAAGLSNEEIAQRLWIEVPTVRKHLEHVFDKLGVRSRTAAVATLRLAPGRERT